MKKIILALEGSGPMTRAQLGDHLGLSKAAVSLQLKTLAERKIIHISGWNEVPKQRSKVPIYAINDAPDAAKPESRSERQKAKLESRSERQKAKSLTNPSGRLRKEERGIWSAIKPLPAPTPISVNRDQTAGIWSGLITK